MLKPGCTHDVYEPNSKTSNERIDFIYVRAEPGISCKVLSSELVGKNKKKADILLPKGVGYPSDHRALVVELELQSLSFLEHSTKALHAFTQRDLKPKRRRRPAAAITDENDGKESS